MLRWSVMIPTYNSARFLAETLESVIRCGVPPEAMQITVVDNCSTDETQSIVERMEGRVAWVRNESNIGMVGNFNRCVDLAKGELVHILNSDDTVLETFYAEYGKAFDAHPGIGLVASLAKLINEEGVQRAHSADVPSMHRPSRDVLPFMYLNPLRTPAVVVRREAYLKLGAFNARLTFCTDWEMWVRVIHQFGGLFLQNELCCYRETRMNETSSAIRSGEAIRDMARIYAMFRKAGYPIDARRARKLLSQFAMEQCAQLRAKGDVEACTRNERAYLESLNIGEKFRQFLKRYF